MAKCTECGTELIGKQRKFCSNKCKGKNGNNRLQNYAAQYLRGLQRKIASIKASGGECQICGYKKNLAALCFHHRGNKSISLDLRSFANNSAKVVIDELDKCDLLCANCHLELHNPQLNSKLTKSDISHDEFEKILLSKRRPERKIYSCHNCGVEVSEKATKCSICQHEDLQKITWPSTIELIGMVKETSYLAVSRKLGVSDNAIRKRIKNHPD